MEAVIAVRDLTYAFGEGPLRREVLHGITTEFHRGEIAIIMGPSGSGKTTLLTLVGALRSVQGGEVRVDGEDLGGLRAGDLARVRQRIGFIFQAHNLMEALTACQNVQMALVGGPEATGEGTRAMALRALAEVGLAEQAHRFPRQLSGGQKQRVAIARALVRRPRIILADEPTASLDRETGRDVVERLRTLAKKEGCTVVLVTHDYRILDTADRIVHLEEGLLSSTTDAILASTQHLLKALVRPGRTEDLVRDVPGMSLPQFTRLMEQITTEAQGLLQVLTLAADEAFERMLDILIDVFTLKAGQLVEAERASLMIADEEKGELWSKLAQTDGTGHLEIRIPLGAGIAGQVFRSGACVNLADAYLSPHFNPEVDRRTGYRTRSILGLPFLDRQGRPFAVLTLLNKRGGGSFTGPDEAIVKDLVASLGVILEVWVETKRVRHLPEPAHISGGRLKYVEHG